MKKVRLEDRILFVSGPFEYRNHSLFEDYYTPSYVSDSVIGIKRSYEYSKKDLEYILEYKYGILNSFDSDWLTDIRLFDSWKNEWRANYGGII